jgi:predicted ArsR family transcriptional regulator
MDAIGSRHTPPPDMLNRRIGVLNRREVEARLLAPLIDALGERFGRDEVVEVIRTTIAGIAVTQGAELAQQAGGDSIPLFADSMDAWIQDNALEIEVLASDAQRFEFNVTRCRYAELYRALGVPELGAIFSCNRDGALMAGFNPEVNFVRTQTIMQGAAYCDFRYQLAEKP